MESSIDPNQLNGIFQSINSSPLGSAMESVAYLWKNPIGTEAGYHETVRRVMLRDSNWGSCYLEAEFAMLKHKHEVALDRRGQYVKING